MIDIDTLTEEEFQKLPLVVEGESKEVRYAGEGLVVIRFKPTIYSFTANRTGIVEGSDALRLRASKILIEELRKSGIKHVYRQINDRWVLAELVLQPATQHDPQPFRPADLSAEQIGKLHVAPPIEVVVKRYHSGTSKHRYYGMAGHPVRHSHPFYFDMEIEDDQPYPAQIVRFDWRNPMRDHKGKWLADEILPEPIADYYINVETARATALKLYEALSNFLETRDIVCYDLCLFVTEDGTTVFGEISQDCGRYRHYELGSLDKDVWRAGGSSADVLAKWDLLLQMLQKEGDKL